MDALLIFRKYIVIGLFFGMLANVQAQKKGKLRFGIDFQYALLSNGQAFYASYEAKYNLADKLSIGLRFGRGSRYNLKNSEISEKEWSNYLATYDTYFHKKGYSKAAFLGVGLGVYSISGFQKVTQGASFFGVPLQFETIKEVSNESKFGFMIRGGIELGKIRLAVEYNLVPKTDFMSGEINNSFLGVGIGFYLGGGKWKTIKDE